MNRLFFICSLLLCLAGGCSVCLAADTWSYPTSKPETPFGGGTGSQSDPYLITSAQELANLAYMVNDGEHYKGKYFKMTTDITLNDNVLNDDGTPNTSGTFKNWTPIGEFGLFWDDDFMGTFDGCGHTIRGLYINGSTEVHLGLFGTIKNAVLKNITLEDCLITKPKVNNGILCGASYQSSCVNIKVSKSLISEEEPGNENIGGIIGKCYNNNVNWSGLCLSNSSFDGTISIRNCTEHVEIKAGGLVGSIEHCYGDGIINCTSKGKIYVDSKNPKIERNTDIFKEYIGGVLGYGSSSNCLISNCINNTDIYINTVIEDHDFSFKHAVIFYISAFANAFGFRQNNCVNFGNVYVGKDDYAIRSCHYLYLSSMVAYKIEDCANYGNFIIKGNYDNYPLKDAYGISGQIITRCINIQNQNDIPNIAGTTKVYPFVYNDNSSDNTAKDCHFYYKNINSAGDLFTSSDIPSGVIRHTDLEDFTNTKPYFSDGEWGVMNEDGNAYNGYPIPVACGGIPTEYNGDGQSESTAYIINTEADLNRLKEYVKNGTSFEGRYFKLGSDISMSGTMNSIGTSEYPFKGHFDGNGHAITGLRNSLFGYMYGTVKNLALVDCHIEGGERTGAIAKYVGDADNNAEISNCYVSGVVQAAMSGVGSAIYQGGICSELRNGSTVHDCYFMGHLIAKGFSGGFSSGGLHLVGGIVGSNTNKSDNPSVSNCYASFDFHKVDLGMDPLELTGICNNRMSNCYFVTSATNVSTGTGCTKLSSESELSASNLGSQWMQGVYRPILTSTKHYAATTPEDTPTTVYFDAIPEANPKKNYIYNVIVSGDPYAEKTVWKLPNLAVYVDSEQKDYITNGYLDQSSALKYKRSEGATGTLGQLHFLLTQNDKGAHFVCLPGEVLKADLPEGSDAMIVGKVTVVNDEEQVNVVHVDTIPAGVPCFIYVPVTSVKSGNNIDMLMRSGIVSEPVMDADYSSFKGTFSPQTVSEQACIDVAKETFKRAATRGEADEEAYYFIRNNEQAEVKPFSAWIESSLGNVRIVDYLLLDEYSKTNEELIENSTDDVNIKLRLTMDADKWTTICLPFDMSGEEIAEKFGQDTKLEEIESISYDGTTLNIRLKEATDGIVTGYPYFIKPSAGNSIFDLGPRILSNELSEDGYMAISPDATRELSLQMGGAYGITVLSSTKDYGAYYFNDGTLIQVSTDKPFAIGGFRCWFKASDAMASAPIDLSSVIITYSDGTTTDISVVAEDSQSTNQTVYDLSGIEMKTEKGIYIKGGKLIIKN